MSATLMFQTAKTALIALLQTGAAAGGYHVVGSEVQSHSADDIASLSHVEVTYDSGDFPKSRGSMSGGPNAHDVTFKITLIVAGASQADLATLENPSSTALQIQTALSAVLSAADAATRKLDQLFADLWNLIMQPLNADLGLGPGKISNRWISHLQRNDTGKLGSYALITGSMDVTLTVMEQPTTIATTPGLGVTQTITVTADISGATTDPAKIGQKVGS